MSEMATLPYLALAPATAGGPITMTSYRKHKYATEHNGSTLRLSRVVANLI